MMLRKWCVAAIVIGGCFVLIAGCSVLSVQEAGEEPSFAAMRLWYDRPAQKWVEALPVGNGGLGAMIYGGIDSEHLQINEDTVWTGKPHDYSHPKASEVLQEIRGMLFEGKQKEAEQLAMKRFMSEPLRQKKYQKFVDMKIAFPHDTKKADQYMRSLDLDRATAAVFYTIDGVRHKRTVFSSYPDQVLVVQLDADRSGQVNFAVSLQAGHEGSKVFTVGKDRLVLQGQVQEDGIRYEASLLVRVAKGQVTAEDGSIKVANADSATLILAGATNFVNFQDISADPAKRNKKTLSAVKNKSYKKLLAAHVRDYRALFRRVNIDLGGGDTANLPTDERIKSFADSKDPEMISLLYQYGRYLLISSSRPGAQPANLQGIWNESNSPPWESKYTTNINCEMNYWPAEPTDLAVCAEPLFAALEDLSVSGAKVARTHYDARGWVLHHNFDLWRGAAPINHSNHGIWPTGGAWLCQHLWEHFLYSGDKTFLRKTAYPVMKASAMFHLDTLVQHPTKDILVSGPSNSPERGGLVMGPTMDHQIIRNLFLSVIAGSEILNTDKQLRQELEEAVQKIAPNEVGSVGQLKEWVDIEAPNTTHRHVSHMWGLHPGTEITPLGSPEYIKAMKKTLELRGDAGTGWSMAWKINIWARLWDGDHSFRLLTELFGKGLYPNMFDAHPPFQIDGNFGAVSGISEWVLQSHDPYGKPGVLNDVMAGKSGYIHLLAALPDAVPAGKISGLRARGGFVVSVEWKEGKLLAAKIKSLSGKPLTVRYDDREVKLNTIRGKTYVFGHNLK